MCVCVCVCACLCVCCVRLFAVQWTVAHQTPLSMELSSQEYWSGLPFPPPGDLPNPGIRFFTIWAIRKLCYIELRFFLRCLLAVKVTQIFLVFIALTIFEKSWLGILKNVSKSGCAWYVISWLDLGYWFWERDTTEENILIISSQGYILLTLHITLDLLWFSGWGSGFQVFTLKLLFFVVFL